MEHKVFYGEYSLKHWIKLMLEGRIVIPEFQRAFVWKEDDVKKLIKSFEGNSFIPPVMIGAYNKDGNNDDYVIDGQQRLSSILLAWLNKFPPKTKEYDKAFASDNDDKYEDETEREPVINWNFKEIQNVAKQHKTTNKEKIADNLNGYSELNLNLSDKFLEYRLGFSYIKPRIKTAFDEQKKFYAKLFRNINTTGIKLIEMEARKALYWFGGNGLEEFFDPNFTRNITVNKDLLDFARILALLSEYKKCSVSGKIDFNKIAKGYGGKKFEAYIVLYIESLISGNNERFDIEIPNDYENRINKIKTYIGKKEYSSMIDADYWLFGLVYFILFENKDIDISREENLKKKIKEKTDRILYDEKKTPAGLKYIRKRLKESIDIYEEFMYCEMR
jgi:uncharacterized protein with ParB-like and HNH nuclease domain